ncbi:AraC family transcriptional regulator [Clostridium lacusfryxellense]|uniref:AraC family transcriptional regulator n=1 Tax=Clostridium lacusfryxellense TaxID=205328 RepID=UPI001C0DC373|nr:AraC family transcriptional regulator [Clostridium lacusfryxellense]MBU3111224.1 AraC family transcriptional regulator [Clostridium lacusfryxellense]
MINIRGMSEHLAKHLINDFGIEDTKNHIGISSCGYQKFISKNLSVTRSKGRTDYQIIYIIKGRYVCTIPGNENVIPEGNFILFKPNEPQYYSYFFEDLTEVYWIHFSGYGASKYLAELGLLRDSYYYVGQSNNCIDLFELILHELQVKNPAYNYIAVAYFYELLGKFCRILANINKGEEIIADDNLQSVIHLMHSNYRENFLISFYADKCNLSTYRFIHKFKQVTGMSPLKYITSIRIAIARDLLCSSPLSIGEVSNLVGYVNPLYFSRMFKKVSGLSPTSYKIKFS